MVWLFTLTLRGCYPSDNDNICLCQRVIYRRTFSQVSNTISRKWKQIVPAVMLVKAADTTANSPAGLVMRSLIISKKKKTGFLHPLVTVVVVAILAILKAACRLDLRWLALTSFFWTCVPACMNSPLLFPAQTCVRGNSFVCEFSLQLHD